MNKPMPKQTSKPFAVTVNGKTCRAVRVDHPMDISGEELVALIESLSGEKFEKTIARVSQDSRPRNFIM